MRKSKRTKTLLTIFLTTILCTILFAQEETSPLEKRGGRGFFMAGWGQLNLDELNSALESKGYPAFSKNFLTLGGCGYGLVGRILLGGHGNALIGKDVTSGIYKMSVGAGYGFFDLGYLIYSDGGLNLYPMIGIGGGGMSLKIYENKVLTFDEILIEPKRAIEISTGSFLLNFAIGADYLFELGEDENGKGGLAIGIRAGYVFSPIKGGWKMEEIEISGGPKVGITGPYVQLMFGGGGYGK